MVRCESIDFDLFWPNPTKRDYALYTIKLVDDYGNEKHLKVIDSSKKDLSDPSIRKSIIDNRIESLMVKEGRDDFIYLNDDNSYEKEKYINEQLPFIKAYSLWKDTKNAYSKVMNPNEDKRIQEVIDVLFNNILMTYNDFIDSVDNINASEEHIYNFYKPSGNPPKWDLMTFLLNRAISNVDSIGINTHLNGYDHRRKICINDNRYERIKGQVDDELIDLFYLKSKFHETGHALHTKVSNLNIFYQTADKMFMKESEDISFSLCSQEDKIVKMSSILNKNGIDKNRIISLKEIENAPKKYGPVPYKEALGSSIFDEAATEYYATKYSGLYDRNEYYHDYEPFSYYNVSVPVPNFDNGYSPYAILFYHFENLMPKEDIFNALYQGDASFMYKFCMRYKDVVDKYEMATGRKISDIIDKAFYFNDVNSENINSFIIFNQLILSIYINEYKMGNIPTDKMEEIIEMTDKTSPRIIDKNGVKQEIPQLSQLKSLCNVNKNSFYR